MKGGSIVCWRTLVGVVGSTSPDAALRPSANVGFWESRVEWPCSVGIRSERVEAVGAKGVYYLDSCGRLGRRDERMQELCGVSLVRSSRRQPSTTACPGGDAPFAGWGSRTELLCGSKTE